MTEHNATVALTAAIADDIVNLAAAIKANDEPKTLAICARLAAQVLSDIHRIADAFESIAAKMPPR